MAGQDVDPEGFPAHGKDARKPGRYYKNTGEGR
jgi:hypothetical protein